MSLSHTTHENSPRLYSRRPVLAAGLIGLFALPACSSSAKESNSAETSGSATPSETPSASSSQEFSGTIALNIEDGAVEHNPVEAVAVTATGATITAVELLAASDGSAAPGELNADKTAWSNTGALLFNEAYTLTVTAKDAQGLTQTQEFTFTTVSAANEANALLNIKEGAEYGVGRILEIHFSEPVVDRAAVEKLIEITGSPQPGKFRWYSNQMVRYRPENYWEPGATINVKINMLGQDIGNGMIGNSNVNSTFRIAPHKRYAFADNNTKTITLYVDDKEVYSAPITLGNSEWPSVVGQLVIMEQSESYFFNPVSLGLKPNDPHWYEPFYAHNVSRLTKGGVFVHQGLPSAYSSIGVANVSHGCIGMLPADAKYFFDTFKVGDIVETVNTGYPQADPDDGYGDWNIPFEHYQDSSWKGNW